MAKVRWAESIEDGVVTVKEWHKVVVHKFSMGDVEDPEIYAAHPIYEWQQTEQGRFIMDHGKDHTFNIMADYNTYGYKCVIQCEIESKKLSEYLLKWGKTY